MTWSHTWSPIRSQATLQGVAGVEIGTQAVCQCSREHHKHRWRTATAASQQANLKCHNLPCLLTSECLDCRSLQQGAYKKLPNTQNTGLKILKTFSQPVATIQMPVAPRQILARTGFLFSTGWSEKHSTQGTTRRARIPRSAERLHNNKLKGNKTRTWLVTSEFAC
jgi:hypothetical protein